MRPTVGSEVQSYVELIGPTGVPRVIRETHRHLLPILEDAGVDLVPVGTAPPGVGHDRVVNRYLASDPVVRMAMRQPEDVDVLLMLNACPTLDVARIVRIRRERTLPTIAMIHDLIPLHRPDWFPPSAGRRYRLLLQQILHAADHVVVPSQEVGNEIGELGWRIKPTIHVIHLGSAFEQQPPREHARGVLDLVYVSTIAPRKGHERLIEAYELLRAKGVPVRLTLVGRIGWEVDDLVARLQGHPDLGTTLRWFRGADDEVVARLLRECTVAVVPTEGEGFGLCVEEALTAGLTVVATDLPVFRERPNPNLHLFDGTVTGLAHAVQEAGTRQAVPLAPGQVRSMRDFAQDLSGIVQSAVRGVR